MFSYKKTKYSFIINNKTISEQSLIILFGICKYSGGLRVIKDPNLKNYLLDITIVKNTSFLDLHFNIPKLYKGDIIHHRKVTN